MSVRTYSGNRTILMACSLCGCSCEFPGEIRRCSDGLWRCAANCDFGTNELDVSRQKASFRGGRDEQRLPALGLIPNWFLPAATTTVTHTFSPTQAKSVRWTGASNDNTWVTLHDGTGALTTTGGTGFVIGFKTGIAPGTWTFIYRWIATFDTSAIGSTATITSASLSVAFQKSVASLAPDINVFSASPANSPSIASTDCQYVGTAPFSTAVAAVDVSSSVRETHVFALNATGLAAISKTGYTALSLRNANYDAANAEPVSPGGSEFDEYTSSLPVPVLTVTVQVPV